MVGDLTYLIANHDCAPWLPDCLNSLLAQTDPRWRAVVLDDASTDDSRAVLARYRDARIRVIVHERNLGYVASLRRLIAEADTDIVAILDADDALAPEATDRLRRRYTEEAGAAFVYSCFAECDETLRIRAAAHGSAVPPGSTVLRDGVIGAIRSFRRSAYGRTSGLDDAMLYAEDRDLVYKLEEVATPVFIDAVLYFYRRRPGSQTGDPHKRELGARNTWRARRAALGRRGIRGMRRFGCELHFLLDYLAYSHRTIRPVRLLARQATRATRFLCRPQAASPSMVRASPSRG